ncbi:HTH CenpB-type DNA-binding domain protein [Kalmanozyma brasiliensis GHG001]|uniref:HTH CenpB-type DNA-binding domain protein n=1 Tax=Kalmanozyma brasiliensis (strain GHG001) TaxID=1365824 RepID=UPI0028681CC1|nr:HTH CenpB-type DNA-binding domain protein [Kalmanozyma brasiliensis GHG001]EST10022.2 HTH CenpB-type DNA-binding domain protein [Kalmanozyma brasiliensis GHG001]
MNHQHAITGLGLRMDGHNPLSDLTNLVASPRHSATGAAQAAEPLQAQTVAKPSDHVNATHEASYDAGSQDTLMEPSPTAQIFHSARTDEGVAYSSGALCPSQEEPHVEEAAPHQSDAQPVCLTQAYGVDTSYNPVGVQAENPAPHHYLHSPTRGSGSQAMTQAHLGPDDGQQLGHTIGEQAHASAFLPKLEASPGVQQYQARSYPCSPGSPTNRPQTLSQSELRSLSNNANTIAGRHAYSHRSSHSLSQATAFTSSTPHHGILPQYHFSAPVSPSDSLGRGPYDAIFQYPSQRHETGPSAADHAHLQRHNGAHGIARNSVVSTAPSMRSASPSASLASTSMTSISPLGSARFNADGSFTSQETSFDSWSNAASGSFSRASSTSDDVYAGDLGSLGLPLSRATPKPKRKLRNIDRKMICDFSASHPTIKQDAIAAKFDIERSTVSKILKNKEKWLSVEPGSEAARISKHRAVKFPAVEDQLASWIAEFKTRGEGVRDSTIRQEALRIARELGLGEDQFKASGGWIEKFRERNHIPKLPIADATQSGLAESLGDLKRSPSIGGSQLFEVGPHLSIAAPSASIGQSPDDDPDSSTHPKAARRQPSRGSKAKAATHKRCRNDDAEQHQAMPAMAPLSQDMARMHFHSASLPGPVPHAAFFQPHVFMGPPAVPQPFPPYAVMSQGYGKVLSSSHAAEGDEAESDRKRRRASEVTQEAEGAVGLGAAFDFRFPPVPISAAPSPSPQLPSPGQASQTLSQAVVTPQKSNGRGRRATARSADGSSRNGSRRGKGRLSNANHAPQTPSPLSMSPAAGSDEAGFPASHADAERAITARLESIAASQVSGDSASSISAEQAKHSLDLVLRYLSEQPGDILPSDHFVVFGNLRANIEHRIQSGSSNSPGPATELQSPLPLPNSETVDDVAVPSVGDH